MLVFVEPFLSLTVGHAFHAVITVLTIVKRWPRGRGCDEDDGEASVRASRLWQIRGSFVLFLQNLGVLDHDEAITRDELTFDGDCLGR